MQNGVNSEPSLRHLELPNSKTLGTRLSELSVLDGERQSKLHT